MKLRIPLFAEFYDYTGAARRLERMAAKGWMLKEADGYVWCFEKAEPQKLHFSVVYFPDISNLDLAPKRQLLDYIAMCEAAGWRLAAQREQMLIFYTAEADPVPIDTDPVIQLETVRKVMKKTHVRGNICLIIFALLSLWQTHNDFSTFPMHYFAFNISLLHAVWMAALLLISCAELITYGLWVRRAKAAAEQGRFVPSKRGALFTLVSASILPLALMLMAAVDQEPMVAVFVLIWCILSTALLGGMRWFGKFLKKQGFDAGSNQVLQGFFMGGMLVILIYGTVGFISDWKEEHRKNPTEQTLFYPPNETWYYYADSLAMSLEDLGVARGNAVYDSRSSGQASVLMESVGGRERPVLYERDSEAKQMPAMEYTLYVAKWSGLRNLIKENRLAANSGFESVSASVWQAERVLRSEHRSMYHYLVIWEDRVLEISFSWEPTDEQITSVAEIMKGGESK